MDSNKPVQIDTGFATRCNNDHGISPDGTQLAISDNSQADHESLVYISPSPEGRHAASPRNPLRTGMAGRLIVRRWRSLASATEISTSTRFRLQKAQEEETRLTTAKGLDDGSEYSPDGNYIYFNSERTGHMQIWRMKPDGSEQEQVFSDELNNWFPHISPDGQWMVFLTYDASVTGHPENKDVMLRLMSLTDKKITVLAKLFGGQGTINVPSWSPDSKRLAFVSYMLLPGLDREGKQLESNDWVRVVTVPLSLQKSRHQFQSFSGFGQLKMVPERMRQSFEDDELGVVSGTQ